MRCAHSPNESPIQSSDFAFPQSFREERLVKRPLPSYRRNWTWPRYITPSESPTGHRHPPACPRVLSLQSHRDLTDRFINLDILQRRKTCQSHLPNHLRGKAALSSTALASPPPPPHHLTKPTPTTTFPYPQKVLSPPPPASIPKKRYLSFTLLMASIIPSSAPMPLPI